MENVLKIVDTFIPTLDYCEITFVFSPIKKINILFCYIGAYSYIRVFLRDKKYGIYNDHTDSEEFFETKELLVAKLMTYLDSDKVEKIRLNNEEITESITIYNKAN
jgi:hypothetical protein